MWPVVGNIVHDYGLVVTLTLALLFGFSYFIYKLFNWIGPFISKQLADANVRTVEVSRLANERLGEVTKLFDEGQKRRDEIMADMFDKISQRLDRHDDRAEARDLRHGRQ